MQEEATAQRADTFVGSAGRGVETQGDDAQGGTRNARGDSAAPRLAVLAAGLAAALALFLVHDHARETRAVEERLFLTARYVAAELADTGPGDAPAIFGFLAGRVPQGLNLFLTDANDDLVAATGSMHIDTAVTAEELRSRDALVASAPISDELGNVLVALDRSTAMQPVWQRGAAAAGIALVLLAAGAWAFARRDGRGWIEEMLDILPYGVARWSAEGELIACNRQYRRSLALEPGEAAPGSPYVETMKRVTRGHTCDLVSEDEDYRVSEIVRDDGSAVLVDERPLAAGGFMTLVSDISGQKRATRMLEEVRLEQKQLARQLREEKIKAEAASRAKTSFLAHLSHDVRTPLNHIIGFADLIAHQTYGEIGDERYLTYIADIKNSGEKLLASFSEILDLAQLEGGQFALRREEIDVAEVIRTAANRFQDTAARAGLTLDVALPENAVIHTDPMCVERMLGNLLENAIQFTPAGGRVRLAGWLADDGVVLEVSDTGIGISQDRMRLLDEPFVLGDAAFAREGGVGLGLAITRAMAELSGGSLAIDSSPAVGTTAAISLPLRLSRAGAVPHAA